MNTEQQQRIEQIRESVSLTKQILKQQGQNSSYNITRIMTEYADFLLSLVKEQEPLRDQINEEQLRNQTLAESIMACEVERDAARSRYDLLISKPSHQRAAEMLSNLHSICIEKVKELRNKAKQPSDDPFINGAVGAYNAVIKELESVSIQEQEQ